ncbi:phosphomevalonate kinase [Rhynchophorus ferrugineus]|uniref:phosphomevalonate kinase n=1 Tax=Rhynchophorus ferrugineus TaxID=354439 RepID=UPI003FCCBC9C
MNKPRVIFLFSGKRKSGKDYICEQLNTKLADCELVRISGPLKKMYADHHSLNWDKLMSDGPYKEHYRENMIKWSDQVRSEDPGYFCRAACEAANVRKIWLVCDIRRKTDIQWFKKNYVNLKTVRISANPQVRKERGWIFTQGIDDVTSECDLDDFSDWDVELNNNNTEECNKSITCILDIAQQYL